MYIDALRVILTVVLVENFILLTCFSNYILCLLSFENKVKNQRHKQGCDSHKSCHYDTMVLCKTYFNSV